MSMAEGIEGQAWVSSISPNLHTEGIHRFLALWEYARQVVLADGEDSFCCAWSPSRIFSARSTYLAFFAGRTGMAGADLAWDSKAPTRCQFFVWLACRRRCWTADRLQRRGLDHPSCSLYDQDQETTDHLLLGCVMAREVWTNILTRWNKERWIPSSSSVLADWWSQVDATGKDRTDAATGATLVLWTIWKHRNNLVFEGARPSLGVILADFDREFRAWRMAGLFVAAVREWRDTG